jgi:hypothetical protein
VDLCGLVRNFLVKNSLNGFGKFFFCIFFIKKRFCCPCSEGMGPAGPMEMRCPENSPRRLIQFPYSMAIATPEAASLGEKPIHAFSMAGR